MRLHNREKVMDESNAQLLRLIDNFDVLGVAQLLNDYREGRVELDLMMSTDEADNTLVHAAMRHIRLNARSDILKLLLEAGADPAKANRHGYSPLHWAANMEEGNGASLEFMRLLIDHGAPVNPADQFGETPFLTACGRGLMGVAKFLIDRGANVIAKKSKGQTALHALSNSNCDPDIQVELAGVLLAHGADINAVNDSGLTPADHACRSGYAQLFQFLLKNRAKFSQEQARGVLDEVLSRRGKKVREAESALALMEYLGLDVTQKYEGKTLLSRFTDSDAKALIGDAIRRRRSEVLSDRLDQAMSDDAAPTPSTGSSGMSL
jgi:ankyrin repeat protein